MRFTLKNTTRVLHVALTLKLKLLEMGESEKEGVGQKAYLDERVEIERKQKQPRRK